MPVSAGVVEVALEAGRPASLGLPVRDRSRAVHEGDEAARRAGPEAGWCLPRRDGGRVRAAGDLQTVEPPHHLEFTWGWAPGADQAVMTGPQRDDLLPPGSSRLVVTLEDRHGATALRLEHRDLANGTLRDNHLIAWETYLARLAVAVTGDDPGSDRHA